MGREERREERKEEGGRCKGGREGGRRRRREGVGGDVCINNLRTKHKINEDKVG